jgi:hypothetical protein
MNCSPCSSIHAAWRIDDGEVHPLPSHLTQSRFDLDRIVDGFDKIVLCRTSSLPVRQRTLGVRLDQANEVTGLLRSYGDAGGQGALSAAALSRGKD